MFTEEHWRWHGTGRVVRAAFPQSQASAMRQEAGKGGRLGLHTRDAWEGDQPRGER